MVAPCSQPLTGARSKPRRHLHTITLLSADTFCLSDCAITHTFDSLDSNNRFVHGSEHQQNHEHPKMTGEQRTRGLGTYGMPEDNSCATTKRQLPFNTLAYFDLAEIFTDSAGIAQWIEVAAHPFLLEWHYDCHSHPRNAQFLSTARADIYAFARELEDEVLRRQDDVASYDPDGGCPYDGSRLWKPDPSLGFMQYTATTACLIAQYSLRCAGEEFKDAPWDRAAVALLMAVIMDLDAGDYFTDFLQGELENNGGEMELDAFDADAAAESLAHGLRDLSVTSDTTRVSDNSTAFSSSDEEQFEEMQERILAFNLADF